MKRLRRALIGLGLLMSLAGAQAATTQIVSQGNSSHCLAVSSSNRVGIEDCNAGSAAQKFELTAGGVIRSGDVCLSAGTGAAGSLVVPMRCDSGAGGLQWQLDNAMLKTALGGLCITEGPRFGSGNADMAAINPYKAQLQACAYNANQKWTFGSGATRSFPGGGGGTSAKTPSSAVSGANLTSDLLKRTVAWIQAETAISNTPFCWKKPGYDRGAGQTQTDCGSKTLKNGLCYSDCRAGYTGDGPVCWGGCPSGYTDTGALCQSKSSLSYRPGSECTARDKLGNCWATQMKSCRDGYTRDPVTQTCWLTKPTVAKDSYGRGAGTLPNGCTNGLVLQAGLCYQSARTGYTCDATLCTQQCASGSTPCGAGCAQNAQSCSTSIIDMVVGPAEILANLSTGGAVGAAAKAVQVSVKTMKTALNGGKMVLVVGGTALTVAGDLQSAITDFMNAAEGDLAAISTADVEKQVAAKYVKGSANYKLIAREYALLQILTAVSDFIVNLDLLAISVADPTGVADTITAYAKPSCTQHTAIPN